MMNSLLLLVLNTICISMLTYMFYFLYRPYRTDYLRIELIEIRDLLSDAAMRRDIEPDALAYTVTYRTLSGMIGFANQLSLMRTLFMLATRRVWVSDEELRSYQSLRRRAMAELAPNGRRIVRNVMSRAHFAVLSHLLHTSVVTVIPAYIVEHVGRLLGTMERLIAVTSRKVRNPAQILDREAFDAGTEDPVELDLGLCC